jgi:hypothetical protein
MAFEFDADAVFKSACAFLAKGVLPLKLHGITAEGYCTCRKEGHHINGAIKQQCGKHPKSSGGWQHTAAKTEAAIEEWLDDPEPFNIGVQLGPKSGIIDIEWDDDEAKRAAESMGITLIETPTYVSGRSEHRLFQWDDRFDQLEKAVVHPFGIEVRLGIGEKGAQSVVPPSWHWKGRKYIWKPTLSIEEVEIAPLPEELIRAIITTAGGAAGSTNRGKARSSRWAIHGPVTEGSRHPTLLALCTKLVMRNERYESDDEQEDIFGLIWNTNIVNCKPPKSREEVALIVQSCVQHRRRLESKKEAIPTTNEEIEKAAADIEAQASQGPCEPSVSGYALHGLELRPVKGSQQGEWLPGDDEGGWSIQMVNSDPPEIILSVPLWRNTPCKGRITFSFDEFRSAKMVASKVFTATRRVILDGDRGEWERIWRGQDANSKRPPVTGLMEKLMIKKDRTKDINVGTSALRYATLASYLLDSFSKATQPRDEEKPEPNASGRACWVTPDKLWFKWAKTWEDIGRTHDVQSGERIRIRHMLCQVMGVDDLPEARHTFGDVRHSYVVFDSAWVEAVKNLAGGLPHEGGESDSAEG